MTRRRVVQRKIEAGAEVASRLHHEPAQAPHLDAEMLYHLSVEARVPDRDEDHVDASLEPEPGRGGGRRPSSLSQAEEAAGVERAILAPRRRNAVAVLQQKSPASCATDEGSVSV